jgi:hypothetical protein
MVRITISLSHTLALVLHFILVLVIHVFVSYHASSPHIPSSPCYGISAPYTLLFSVTLLILATCSHTHASAMGSRFLVPCTELICSGSVSDFVTMSEPLDQGAKG